MTMIFFSWLLLLLETSYIHAKIIPKNERCVTAVNTAYDYISFAGLPNQGLWELRCRNQLRVLSFYAASEIYCHASERVAGLAQLEAQCRDSGGLIPRDDFAVNLTDDAVSRMRVVDFREPPKREVVDASVLISKSYFSRVSRTIDAWEFELWSHYAFGYVGYAYWVVVIAAGTLHKLALHTISSRRLRLLLSALSPVLAVCHWLQAHLIIPPFLASHGRRLLWWTFPRHIDTVIVVLFWVLSTLLCVVGYRIFPGNIYWPEVSAQTLRYVADRTGILSFANIPLLWLFAGRNNIFLWVTGWSFSTFSLFHRHVAWIATIQAVVHTILYAVLFIQAGNVWKKMHKPYLLWGTVAMAAMLLTFPFAIDWVRRRAYETFLVLHILLSIAALVGCFYHVIIFDDREYWFYLWPAAVLWVLDRFLRLVRVMYCNLDVRIGARCLVQCTTASARYDEEADVIRVELFPNSQLRPAPGQYYYLYQPFRLTGWENHPFTLGAWSHKQEDGPSSHSQLKDDYSENGLQIPLLPDSFSGSEYGSIATSRSAHDQLALLFWIRPYDGWTRHLRDQCLRSPTRTIQPTILLEGPYGGPAPLSNYDSILLIAGGTGIATAVPYIQYILGSSTIRPREMHLVWTARQLAFIRDVAMGELKHALGREEFRASFYITSSSSVDPAGISGNVEIVRGRPDLQALILTHAQESRLAGTSMAVLVCGPSGMADQARAAVYLAMRRGCRSIRYVEESFHW